MRQAIFLAFLFFALSIRPSNLAAQEIRPFNLLSLEDIVASLQERDISAAELNAHGKLLLRRAAAAEDPLQSYIITNRVAASMSLADLVSPDSALYYHVRALEYVRLLDDPGLLAAAYIDYGVSLKDFGYYSLGQRAVFQALDIYQEQEDEVGTIQIYRRLCDFCRHSGEYDQALDYVERVIEYYRANRKFSDVAFAQLCQLSTYADMENYPAVIELGTSLLADTTGQIASGNSNWTYVADILETAFLQVGDTARAIKTVKDRIALLPVKDEKTVDYLVETARLHHLEGNHAGAVAAFAAGRSLHDTPTEDFPQWWPVEFYVASLEQTGKYREASQIKQVMLGKLKSELREITTIAANEKRIAFATELKEATIQDQEAALSSQRRVQALTFGLLGLALIALTGLFLGLYYNRMRSRQLAVVNTKLNERNSQNELLLQEIHHRVKNNLEVVSSLLELQSAGLEDTAARNAMQAGQSRVQSMGLLHQKLYQGPNLASIEMGDYLRNLADSLLETYEAENRISVTVSMEPLELDIDTAIPLGLIVNELLTNAIKYAYPGGHAGAVQISLNGRAKTGYQLTVADSGIGKKNTTMTRGTGFGTRLVSLLTRQLGGHVKEFNEGGLRTVLTFQT